jgi:hypothetical protein
MNCHCGQLCDRATERSVGATGVLARPDVQNNAPYQKCLHWYPELRREREDHELRPVSFRA